MKKVFIPIIVALVVLSFTAVAFAIENNNEQQVGITNDEAKAGKEFITGVKFGAGVMVDILTDGKKPVQSARVVNGIVRSEEEGRSQVGVVAEVHSLWPWCIRKPNVEERCSYKNAHLGVGPALGIKLGSNNVIDAIFLGAILAFRPDLTSTKSFNIAIGGILAPKVQVLGDGIENGQPLPTGETEVRFKKEDKYGYAILLSFAWY